jgi:hypothetical protein
MNSGLDMVSFMAPPSTAMAAFHPSARPMFERALWQGRLRGVIARLLRRSRRLYALDKAVGELPHHVRREEEVRAVPLASIKGTLDRHGEFDYDFYPLDEHLDQRWMRIASMMLQGMDLPPVELIQRGDHYYVVDGHHRVSVARHLRQVSIDAVIVSRYA